MTWKVLVSAPYLLPDLDRYMPMLEENGVEAIRADVRERMDEEELLAVVNDIDGAICGDDRFSDRVMEAAPKLKVISKWGTGIDSIDQEAAARRGIKICNTPGAFSEPVADTVLGYMLNFARNLHVMDKDMRNGKWDKRMGRSLGECTLGVIGVGNCGKAVLRRANVFGMKLLGNDIVEIPASFTDSVGVSMVSKEDLLKESDFVSLNCTLNPTSYHLMGPAEFEIMKPTAYLVNTCRGPVVHETALVAALEDSSIGGAALDVFEDEPLPLDSRLRTLTNCMLAPHNANSSPRAWLRVHESTIGNLLEALRSSE